MLTICAFRSPLHDNVSQAMKYYKSLRDKSNKDIANALDIPTTTISAWNTGRHLPDMDRLQKLAEYLDAPIEDFFQFSPSNSDAPAPGSKLQEPCQPAVEEQEPQKFLAVYSQLSKEDQALLRELATKLLR